ncbi:hypothetical protein P3T16_005733 [Paraburkholderia sp. GAS42]|jgi:hypothetical protein
MPSEEFMFNRLSTAPAATPTSGQPAEPRRRLRRAALACVGVLMLAGCAQPWQQFRPGEDQSALITRLGAPRETYDLPNGSRRLMWPTQPMGETTTAADVDAAGKILSVRQVLQPNEFYRADIGKWTRDDVLVNFGRPVETSYFPLMKREVWTYRYLEDNIWYMMFSFYFDDQGVLRTTQKSPDPLHDPSRRNFF